MTHMKPLSLCIFIVALLLSCQSLNPSQNPSTVTKYLPRQSDGRILVANGSGDSGSLSDNLDEAVLSVNLNLQVETFNWSHGRGQSFADHVDQDNHEYQANRLAEQVKRLSAASGNTKIYLMSHSSGCAVILRAAEKLSPGTLEKIVLLAPSVPETYDLRPALQTARRGIDSYYSSQDQLILGAGMMILGTTDASTLKAAGLYGFKMNISQPSDTLLYQKLRQYPWDQSVASTGNNGNHYGALSVGYLKAYVLPNMMK